MSRSGYNYTDLAVLTLFLFPTTSVSCSNAASEHVDVKQVENSVYYLEGIKHSSKNVEKCAEIKAELYSPEVKRAYERAMCTVDKV